MITWLNRGTLHLVASEDYFWLHALTTPPLATSKPDAAGPQTASARIRPSAPSRWCERELAANGPMTGPALRERLRSAAIPTDGQAFIHVMFDASLRGGVVRGPMIGRQHAYVLVGDWLPGTPQARRRPRLSAAPNSLAAISPVTARPTRPTSPAGPGSALVTPAPGCGRSRAS